MDKLHHSKFSVKKCIHHLCIVRLIRIFLLGQLSLMPKFSFVQVLRLISQYQVSGKILFQYLSFNLLTVKALLL